MSALTDLSEEEAYLVALLTDDTGIDFAEFEFLDQDRDHGRFRLFDYQWALNGCQDAYQVTQGARATGKSMGIQMRAAVFPFCYPGNDLLLTAPELNHLRPLTSAVEERIKTTWLTSQLLPANGKTDGFTRQPHWEARFVNGAKIVSRLPNKDGRGVKGSVSESTLVLTKRGYIPARDVRIGDLVLTHLGRWRPVIGATVSEADLVEVAMTGHRGMFVSWNHRFHARRNLNPQRRVRLAEPTWLAVDDPECRRWYVASPATFPESITPTLPGAGGREVAWLLGRWVADGNLMSDKGRLNRIAFTVKPSELSELEGHARAAGYRPWSRLRENGTYTVMVNGVDLARFARDHFGHLAAGKRVPVWLLGAQSEIRSAWLDGYLSGDGYWDAKKERWTAGSASKELCHGVILLAQSVGLNASYSWVDPKRTHVMGVTLKGRPARCHRATITNRRTSGIRDGLHSWKVVRRVTDAGRGTVVSLAVADDHSYVAEGFVHHNQHSLRIELDEAQDYPLPGWVEIVECLNRFDPRSQWRCHGVPRGVRDRFYEITMGANSQWKVHRPLAMGRPSWSPEERTEKIQIYGGSRQSNDYRRNVYGEHGDSSNALFVLARLVAATDMNEGSEYNTDVYSVCRMEYEALEGASPLMMIDLPGVHRSGWAGAPKGYSSYHMGMDVGVTNHPSEVLVFGQRAGTSKEQLDLLLRVHMQRIPVDDQEAVLDYLFAWYGARGPWTFGIDKTGVGFPLWQRLEAKYGPARVKGYNFSSKYVIGLEDRELERGEKEEDLQIERNIVEYSSDLLREMVDAKAIQLPFDRELLQEFQGQTYVVVKTDASPYGTRNYSRGKFHTLDAAKMAVAAMRLAPLDEILNSKEDGSPVLDVFVGL